MSSGIPYNEMPRRKLTPVENREIVIDPSSQRLRYVEPTTQKSIVSHLPQVKIDTSLPELYSFGKALVNATSTAVSSYVNKNFKKKKAKSVKRTVDLPLPSPSKNVYELGLYTSGPTIAPKVVVKKSIKTNSPESDNQIVQVGDYSKLPRMVNNRLSSRQIVRAPVAKSTRVRQSNKPVFKSRNGNIVIRHSEMVGTVVSPSATYNCVSYVINPGKTDLFDWLSTMAHNYDKYRILSLTATFVSSQATSLVGKIGIGIDYDSTDPKPADRGEFFSLTHHVECAPWDSMSFSPPMQGGIKFINSHTNTDSKLIDYGQLLVMTDLVPGSNITVGDLLVDYEVELMDPQQATHDTQVFGYPDAATTFVPGADYPTIGGPSIATIGSATSATVFNMNLSEGYYMIGAWAYDSVGGVPTMVTTDSANVTAYGGQGANGNNGASCGVYKVVGGIGAVSVTLGTVTLSNCEGAAICVSRISASAFAAFPAVAY